MSNILCGNCGGCGCQQCGYVVVLPEHPDAGLTFQNQNITGVGTFDNQTGNVVGFRGAASANAFMTVALDAPNKVVLFTIDVNALAAAFPAATTVQTGVLETATDAEAIAKVATDKIVTPSNFAAMASSLTFAGLVELATNAETQAGVSTTLAVTPAGLASVTSAQKFTTTFADAVARAGTNPDFDGQFAAQLDTDQAWLSFSTNVGDWNGIMTFGATNLVTGNTGVDFSSSAINLTGPGGIGLTDVDLSYQDAAINIDNSFFILGNSSTVSVDFASVGLSIGGVAVPAASVLTTAGLGSPSSALISTFLSNDNTQIYGLPTGAMARTTFATYAGQAISNPPSQAEVQALDNAVVIVSQRLAALITDLRATLKPHAT